MHDELVSLADRDIGLDMNGLRMGRQASDVAHAEDLAVRVTIDGRSRLQAARRVAVRWRLTISSTVFLLIPRR